MIPQDLLIVLCKFFPLWTFTVGETEHQKQAFSILKSVCDQKLQREKWLILQKIG